MEEGVSIATVIFCFQKWEGQHREGRTTLQRSRVQGAQEVTNSKGAASWDPSKKAITEAPRHSRIWGDVH